MYKFKKTFSILLTLAMALILLPTASFADTTYTPTKFNGWKIYLSPAKHNPDKIGCDNFSENANASAIATETAKELKEMGYIVRVGSGDYVANSNSSNAWGADLHIPIHSNATTFDCKGTNPRNGGTWVMYDEGFSNSQSLAQEIEDVLDSYSPGTNDKVLTDVEASGFTYYEFGATYADDAYIEVAFHTYGPDKDWMLNHTTVGRLIARGIHNYTGANDCRFETCMTLNKAQADNLNSLKPINVIERKEIGFDYTNFGRKYSELEHEINNLFKSNTSIFSSISNESMLNGVSIDENGTVIVDFKNFNASAPSTSIKKMIFDDLYKTIFADPQVNQVYVQFDGSFSKWCSWLETPEEPIKRKN